MASRSSRALVTGAAGFTGRHLCAHLREHGFDVVGLNDQPSGMPGEIVADLLDPKAVLAAVRETAPDVVVHLAAIAFPGHAHADAVYSVNLGGTLSLLEALAATGAGQGGVILPSTGTVYANASQSALTEDSPTAPSTHYAVSKLAMEHMARLFAGALPIVVVRPFNYTGPGQREPYLVPKIVRHFAQRAPVIELGNIDVERDFLDVRMLRRVRDFAQVLSNGVVDLAITEHALKALNVDEYGLDDMDNKILLTIIEKFKGGPVGITTIATAVGEEAGTLEEVYEPFLIQEGFLQRTPRGREVTAKAYEHLGKISPGAAAGGTLFS